MRIKSSQTFSRIFRKGVVAADGVLVMHAVNRLDAAVDGPEQTQLGLAVSKKVGNAPRRNRWKRLIREAFRQQRSSLPEGLQIVVRPKKGAKPDFHAIERSIVALSHRVQRKLS
ncbi:MAG: ribonuclease P protein component [Aureliella sp.]